MRTKIQQILDGDYNTKEKIKINGEVFTPFLLIEEMIDKLPAEVWNDPNKTWLDPAAGLGNFHAIVFNRLMKGLSDVIPDEEERRRHILEKQLYFVELNEESAKLIKQIFDPENKYNMNIVCADFLDEKHPGWNDVGYMWNEDDIGNPLIRYLKNKKKEIELEIEQAEKLREKLRRGKTIEEKSLNKFFKYNKEGGQNG